MLNERCSIDRFLMPALGISTWIRLPVFVLSLIITIGCSEQVPPPASTVDGKVTYRGQPVTGGTVTFHIQNETGKVLPYAGEIDPQGNYELTNAVPGTASISVETATQEGLPNYFPLPDKFSSADKSGLKLDIQLGHQQHDIEIQ